MNKSESLIYSIISLYTSPKIRQSWEPLRHRNAVVLLGLCGRLRPEPDGAGSVLMAKPPAVRARADRALALASALASILAAALLVLAEAFAAAALLVLAETLAAAPICPRHSCPRRPASG